MFIFEKRTEFPVKINNRNPRLAGFILSQYGGPDGELGASLRYLSQRFAQKDKRGIALLTDIGTEELSHLEMIGSIVTQLTKGEGAKSFDRYGNGSYYIDHANGVYPASAAGVPFTAAYLQSKADPIADIMEDMAAEQKARATYDNILRISDDPDVNNVIRFLREREIVHFQRFGDTILTKLRGFWGVKCRFLRRIDRQKESHSLCLENSSLLIIGEVFPPQDPALKKGESKTVRSAAFVPNDSHSRL